MCLIIHFKVFTDNVIFLSTKYNKYSKNSNKMIIVVQNDCNEWE